MGQDDEIVAADTSMLSSWAGRPPLERPRAIVDDGRRSRAEGKRKSEKRKLTPAGTSVDTARRFGTDLGAATTSLLDPKDQDDDVRSAPAEQAVMSLNTPRPCRRRSAATSR
jgi:hypothetical protein